MRYSSFLFMSGFIAASSAHFHLQFPPPRGLFVEANEVNFCDSYPNSVANRTVFPLSGGFISINSEHPLWTLGVELSTLANPQSFQNFSEAVPFFQVTGEGAFCFPVDFAASGISGLTDGANVTIQLEFNGGDGNLFQCADLTLSSTVTVPNNVSCTNATGDTVQTLTQSGSALPSPSGSLSGSASGSAPAPSGTNNAASVNRLSAASGLMALFGATVALL